MNSEISQDTQAILLLTSPLIGAADARSRDLLSFAEYKRLARHLRQLGHKPADLVAPDAAKVMDTCRVVVDGSRLARLISRGFALSQAIERWRSRAIWVLSRADTKYPRRLKVKLREDAPALIYGCGDAALLENGGLAVVGSRHVDDSLIEYTIEIGQLAARAGKMVISGGAKGVDQAAMRGAAEAGGRAVGVLADSLEKTAVNREHRNMLLDRQLVLISPYDPGAGFNVGNAMQRNKLIYALSDLALVVSSDLNKGGTWAGATEQLERLNYAPVYVRSTGQRTPGLDALRNKGALAWPNPTDTDTFLALFRAEVSAGQPDLSFESNDLEVKEATPASLSTVVCTNVETEIEASGVSASNDLLPARVIFEAAKQAIQLLLTSPMTEKEIAESLDVSAAQLKVWLRKLVDEGAIEKKNKPNRYVARQRQLFN